MSTKSFAFILFLLNFSMILTKNTNFLKINTQFSPILTQLLTTAIIQSNSVGAYCFLNSNGTVFNLNPLTRKNDDYNRTFLNGDTLQLNMCSRAVSNCPNKTALATYKYKNVINTLTGQAQCISLSGNETTFANWTILCKK